MRSFSTAPFPRGAGPVPSGGTPRSGGGIMANPGQSREIPCTLWRTLRMLIARRLAGLRQLLSWRREAEVFPWMEHSAAVAAVLGALLAIGLGRMCHLGTNGLILGALLGAIAGTLGGILLALSWAVEVPGPGASPVAERLELWDPWLDEDEECRERRPLTASANRGGRRRDRGRDRRGAGPCPAPRVLPRGRRIFAPGGRDRADPRES